MKHSTRHHLPAVIVLLCLLACKKNNITKVEKPGPEKPREVKKYIPVKFEATGLTLHLKYKDQTAQLTEVDEGGGNRMVITYKNEQYPYKLEKYRNGSLFNIVYYVLNEEKNVGKAVTFDYDGLSGNYTPTGSYTLDYNNLNQLHTVRYFDHTDKPGNTFTRSYVSSGSLLELSLSNGTASGIAATFTFDQKKGISGLIPYCQLFTLESPHWFLFCSVNNILSWQNPKSPLENINFSYEYNEDGYPSKMNISKNKNTQTVKVTYALLE